MSLYDYRESQKIDSKRYGFYALIMAAMRNADDINLNNLRKIFPDVHAELAERYNSPGGLLSSDK